MMFIIYTLFSLIVAAIYCILHTLRKHAYFVLLISIFILLFSSFKFLHPTCHSFSNFLKRMLTLISIFSFQINAHKTTNFYPRATLEALQKVIKYTALPSFFSSWYFLISTLILSLMNRLFIPYIS